MTPEPHRPRKERLFVWGTVYALLGGAFARLAPPGYFGLLAVCLSTLGLLEVLKVLFAWHREVSWSGGDPSGASRALAGDLLAIQAGAILGFAVIASLLPLEEFIVAFRLQIRAGLPIRIGAGGEPMALAATRTLAIGLAVAGFSAVLSGLYKEGGLSLVAAWIGSLWGVAATLVAQTAGAGLAPLGGLALVAALAAGTLGYAMAGMAGLFIGRGAQKYGVRSVVFRSILRSSLALLAAAVAAEAVAAAAAAAISFR